MRLRMRYTAFLGALFLVASCGGGSGGGDPGVGTGDGEGTPFEGVGEAASGVELLQAGSVTSTADPGQAWVEVEGQRIEFNAADATQSECLINEEQLSVLYQTEEGAEVRLNGLLLPDGWNLSLTVIPPGQDNISYQGSLRSGRLGIEGTALSYEGSVDRLENGDVATATPQEVGLAANCES